MTADERRLLRAYRALPEAQQAGLLDYAEFLLSRGEQGEEAKTPQTPLDIPRPDRETVVKAIRRLRATYPMLERDQLLNEASALMIQHVLHKRPAPEVIDELESLFKRYYDQHAARG